MVARAASAADQTVYSAWVRGLELALSGTGFVSGGTPSAQGTPDMTVALAAGSYRISGTTYTLAGQNATITAAHATLTRTDLISVDSTGTATVTAGTPAAAPSATVLYADPPDLPSGHVPIALVEVGAAQASITDSRIVDIRSIIPLARDLIDAKGDLLAGTASDTISRLAVGANDTILMADSGEATGLRWQAPATTAEIADVAEAEAAGTSDTWARGDHVHSGAAYLQEAIVDAKGDLIAATAADTPARLAVGANDTILQADSAQATGLKWTALGTGATQPAAGNHTTPAASVSAAGHMEVNDKRLLAYYSAGNSGASLTIDWNNGASQHVTMTGNCTFTFSNPAQPGWYALRLAQDATGSRTATWPATVKWSGATAPTLTTTASRVDLVTFYWDGAAYLGASILNYTV